MLSYLDSFFADPKGMLIMFLLAFPGRILALSAHEFAHAWVANQCGDNTAKMLGRLTLNPFKHLDPLGTIMMLLVGFGWAKPVPVNPRNYRNYRADDLKVSVAGVTMNFALFVLSMIAMFVIVAASLKRVPSGELNDISGSIYRASYGGQDSLFFLENGEYVYLPLRSLLRMLPYAGDYLVAPVFGEVLGYLYQMLGYFAVTNLVLCVFNLLPVPPLDGYHVLNDLVLGRSLFADPKGMLIMFLLAFPGRILALSAHEFAHAWVANQCGDNT
ncbi:MAG: hypothetical protein IJ646_01685, partial [Clostridia bacterium]|nr:hypothetical protein [Clostridia bacterium]